MIGANKGLLAMVGALAIAIVMVVFALVVVIIIAWNSFHRSSADAETSTITTPVSTAIPAPTCPASVIKVAECWTPSQVGEAKKVVDLLPLHPATTPNFTIEHIDRPLRDGIIVSLILVIASGEEGWDQAVTFLEGQDIDVAGLQDAWLIQFRTKQVDNWIDGKFGSNN